MMGDDSKKQLILFDLEANGFKRISETIQAGWGSLKLQQYLEKLLADDRDEHRNGFPKWIWEGLLEMSLIHEKEFMQSRKDVK